MMIIVFTVFCAIFGSVLAAPPRDLYISGGDDAAIRQYPYQVSLQAVILNQYIHQCGGAIISPNWIITAAHCLTIALAVTRVVAGVQNLTSDNDDHMQVRNIDFFNIVVHPNYTTEGWSDDLALLKMTEPFVFDDFVQPILISKVECVSNDNATFTGFGLKEIDGDNIQPSPILQVAELTVLTFEQCYTLLSILYGDNINYSDEKQVCTVGAAGPCILDDGGPLRQDSRLIGILSWLPAICGTDIIPTVYTRIGYYAKFIESVVTDLPVNEDMLCAAV